MKKTKLITYSLLILLFIACAREGRIPTEIKLFMEEAQNNPQNEMLIKQYIEKALFYEQSPGTKKNLSLLLDLRRHAQSYIQEHPQSEYMKTYLARIQFQLASYYNSRANFISASEYLQDGIEMFSVLEEEHPKNLYIRLYKAINFLNIPSMFQDKDDIEKDFFLITSSFEDLENNSSFFDEYFPNFLVYNDNLGEEDILPEYRGLLSFYLNTVSKHYEGTQDKLEVINKIQKKIAEK